MFESSWALALKIFIIFFEKLEKDMIICFIGLIVVSWDLMSENIILARMFTFLLEKSWALEFFGRIKKN